jgi:hypothetical protein
MTAFESDTKRIEFEQFVKYLALIQPRTALDQKPLARLRCGVMNYLVAQLEGAGARYKLRSV